MCVRKAEVEGGGWGGRDTVSGVLATVHTVLLVLCSAQRLITRSDRATHTHTYAHTQQVRLEEIWEGKYFTAFTKKKVYVTTSIYMNICK